ncbi:MAG: hypothetical protein WDW38_009545 [Sanguina aurantia]
MPKDEIGAQRYIQEYPKYDGRGTVIAVFDTGVDPGAAGLQITTDGKPKILDVIDCTGSGDIDTSTLVKADEQGTIQAAAGREGRLVLNTTWVNPTGEWRVGSKHLYDLFSGGLTYRTKDERRRLWDAQQRLAVTAAATALSAFDRVQGAAAKLSEELKKTRSELEGRVALLRELGKSYEDVGPCVDAVVWHDGSVWRSAIDTSELHELGSGKGLLKDALPLANYRLEHQYGTFSEVDCCNYVSNVYDDGAILSIVVDAGAHGTHVAGIAAAHFPDDAGSNGVAPGAQVISCKIGDSRLGSMETGTGLTRALIAVLDHKADVINMSYGEPTSTPNAGRFIDLATEIVNKHGVIFVSSAGNAGPALSTVGAPGGTSSALYSIGAYVSPNLAAAGHSVREPPAAGQQYTWSSRGPTPDGHQGVMFSAPGGAIAPVPQWTLQTADNRLRLRIEDRVALTTTAPWLSCPSAVLMHHSGRSFEVRVDPTGLPAGLHYAEVLGCSVDEQAWQGPRFRLPVTIVVPLQVRKWEGVIICVLRESVVCCRFRLPVAIVVPLQVRKLGRVITCVLGLKLFVRCMSWLPVAIVVPLQLPTDVPNLTLGPLEMQPGSEHRHFVAVPNGATWAEVLLRSGTHDTPKIYLFRATQLRPDSNYKEHETRTQVTMTSNAEHTVNIPVSGGSTMEVTLAQFWSSLGDSSLTYEIQFHGVGLASSGDASEEGGSSAGGVAVDGSEGMRKILLTAPLRNERIKPEAKLTTLRIPLRPTEALLQPLPGPRDLLPEGRTVHRLLLTYKLTVTEPGKYKPCLMLLNEHIYDSSLEAQLYMLHDSNKRLLSTGDAYPEYVSLKKGEHTIRAMLRHDSPDFLDKLKGLPMVVKRRLDTPLALPVYGSMREAVAAGNAAGEVLLRGGEAMALFLGSLPDDKLPKDATQGRMLTGTLSLGQLRRGGSGAAPARLPLSYLVQPPPEKAANGGSGAAAVDPSAAVKTVDERLGEALRDAQIAFMKDLELSRARPGPTGLDPAADTPDHRTASGHMRALGCAAGPPLLFAPITHAPLCGWGMCTALRMEDVPCYDQRGTLCLRKPPLQELKLSEPAQEQLYLSLQAACKAAYPTHLPLLTEHLNKMDAQRCTDKDKKRTVAQLDAVVAAADGVIAAIDQTQLAVLLSVKCPEDTPAASLVKKEAEEKRAALIDALAKKAIALLEREELLTPVITSAPPAPSPDAKPDAVAAVAAAAAVAEVPLVVAEAEVEGSEADAAPAHVAGAAAVAEVVAAAAVGAAAAGADKADVAAAVVAPAADVVMAAFNELRRYVDTSSEVPHLMLHSRMEARAKRYTTALRSLDKLLADEGKPAAGAPSRKELHTLRAAMYVTLGWAHLAKHEAALQPIRYPTDFPLF